MRIISDFKDYYDSVQGIAQDRSLVYVRKKEVTGRDVGWGFRSFWTHNHFSQQIDIEIVNHVIGFCDKVYPCLQLRQRVKGEADRVKFCYTLEEVDEFITKNYKERYVEHYWLKEHNYNRMRWPWHYRHENFKKFFEEFSKEDKSYKKRFEDHHCPIFVGTLHNSSESYNCEIVYHTQAINHPDTPKRPGHPGTTECLKDVEFFRVFDPYMAFQELSMYLGNIAEPRKPIPKISDEDMVEIKGFDQFSFRKPKSK